MSELKVQFFARLREQLEVEHMTIDWPETASVEDLINAIEEEIGEVAHGVLKDSQILVAVNQTMVSRQHQVSFGDEVAFLPPVTGG